jgi:L-fucose mutarotase
MPLKGIPAILTPQLLSTLASMGHGDELLISDINFPASSQGREVLHMQGSSATDLLQAILTLFPLDSFAKYQATVMSQVHSDEDAPIIGKFFKILADSHLSDGAPSPPQVERVGRFAFYERSKAVYAIVASGETQLYGNIIIKKGVLNSAGNVVFV